MKDKIYRYLEQVANITISFQRRRERAPLPLYLAKLYEFAEAAILDVDIVLITVNESGSWPSIPNLKKHFSVILKAFQAEPVFVFEKRVPIRLTLLAKNNLAYVYINNEIYLPFFILKLRTKERRSLETHKPNLIKLPQVIVTHQLLHGNLGGLSVSEISRRLRLPKISVSRALNQLAEIEICDIEVDGRYKRHLFPPKDELWEQVKTKMVNPVSRTMFLDKLPGGLNLVKSGISALAKQTLIDDVGEQTFAVQSNELRKFKLKESSDPSIILEIWQWDPRINALDGATDPISTYFSLLHTDDERVAIARDEYLASIGLKIN